MAVLGREQPETIEQLEERVRRLLKRDGANVERFVLIDLSSEPGVVLFVNEYLKARTAWIWHRPVEKRERAHDPDEEVIVEHGFAAEPSARPEWA